MKERPQEWDGSPSIGWRMREFLRRNIGVFILAGLIVLWVYAPGTAVAILDANMDVVRRFAKWLAAVVPSAYGGSILVSVTDLLDSITTGLKEVLKIKLIAQNLGLSDRTELVFRSLYEGIFLYFEIKILRFLFQVIFLAWRSVAKVGTIRHRASVTSST
jgi:hypothetical protein